MYPTIMKIRLLLTLLGAAALTVSCIKDEPLNAEAEIIECTVPGDIVKTDPKIADNTVMILITKSPRRMGAGTNPTWSA